MVTGDRPFYLAPSTAIWIDPEFVVQFNLTEPGLTEDEKFRRCFKAAALTWLKENPTVAVPDEQSDGAAKGKNL